MTREQKSGVFNVARMINATSKLPLEQRALAVSAIVKNALDLPHEELALCLTLLGVTVSGRPILAIDTAREWVQKVKQDRANQAPKDS